jgi:hypothetical protein
MIENWDACLTVKSDLLLLQVLLSGIGDWHIACVYAEAWLLG